MKKDIFKKFTPLMMAVAMLSLSACSDDDDTPALPTDEVHHFAYAANADNGYNVTTFKDFTDGTSSTYTDAKTLVTGHLSFQKYGKYVFAISGSLAGYAGEQTLHRYTISEKGRLTDEVTLSFANSPNVIDIVIANDTKAYAATNGHNGELIIFNPSAMTQTGEIDLSSYAATDATHTQADGDPDMGNGIIVGDYLYLPLSQFNGGLMSYQLLDVDGQIAIINIKTDVVEKIITTNQVQTLGMIGHTAPVVIGEYIYFNSGPLAGMFGMKEGIVRVNTSTREFDADYHVSLQTIDGGETGSFAMQMIGGNNGKIYFFLEKPSLVIGEEGDYAVNKDYVPYELDVTTKNGKILEMQPSSGWAANALIAVGDNIYFGEHATNGTGFFRYNTQTGDCESTPCVTTPTGAYKVIGLD